MNSRKKLVKSIQQLEKKIKAEKLKAARHESYFKRLIAKNSTTLLLFLLPSFLAGWSAGKNTRAGKRVLPFFKFIGLSVLTNLRR